MLNFIKHMVLALVIVLLLPSMAGAQASHNLSNGTGDQQQPLQPVLIEDMSKVRKTADYYLMQQKLWEQQVTQKPGNANAWLNYYKAARAVDLAKGLKTISPAVQSVLDDIVLKMEQNIPGTFEFHYAKYVNGNYDPSLFNHLEKAYEVQPGRTELYREFILYYSLQDDDIKKKDFCKKWYDSKDIAPSVYEYNRNVLASLQANAVLYTNGDYDTYPLLILQEVEGLRTDVTVINVPLLDKSPEGYRMFQNAGIVTPTESNQEEKGRYLADIALLNKNRPFYFALSLSREYLKPVKEELYITGMAFRYSPSQIDNIAELKNNFSDKIFLAYLDKASTYDKKYLFNRETVHSLHLNYVMPLLILYDAWKTEGSNDKAEEALRLARKLALQGGKQELLNSYLQGKKG